jgi:hypothetical protein
MFYSLWFAKLICLIFFHLIGLVFGNDAVYTSNEDENENDLSTTVCLRMNPQSTRRSTRRDLGMAECRRNHYQQVWYSLQPHSWWRSDICWYQNLDLGHTVSCSRAYREINAMWKSSTANTIRGGCQESESRFLRQKVMAKAAIQEKNKNCKAQYDFAIKLE